VYMQTLCGEMLSTGVELARRSLSKATYACLSALNMQDQANMVGMWCGAGNGNARQYI
jgi:hypothetical protein